MINFEAFQDQQDFMIQRFRSASSRIRRAFTPPPSRRGSENQDSDHSDVQMQIQENQSHAIQNVSATSRSLIALIMSIMHFMVQSYQFSVAMFKKVKQITVMLVSEAAMGATEGWETGTENPFFCPQVSHRNNVNLFPWLILVTEN